MKNKLFTIALSGFLLFSCSKETGETTSIQQEINLTSQIQTSDWKKTEISLEIINNQQNISHYEFNIEQLQKLTEIKDVNYFWFDIGLNKNKQITFTATAENINNDILGQVPATIITTKRYPTDFSVLTKTQEVDFGITPEITHILPHQDAYQYITDMGRSYNNFEATLDQQGQRVERFGLGVNIVKRMLLTKNIHALALFLGKNKQQKMTTVFITKDKTGKLLIDNSTDLTTAGRAFDFTNACPTQCDPECTICIEHCGPFDLFCCTEIPCDEGIAK